MEYQKIEGFNLEVSSSESGVSRIMVFRSPGKSEPMEQVDGARILLIGGEPVKDELRNLLAVKSRSNLQPIIPNGIGGRAHTALRSYVGL